MTLQTATNFVDIALVSLCFFCAQLLLLRRHDVAAYVPLALLFLFTGLSTLSQLIAEASGNLDKAGLVLRIRLLFALPEIACPFLFWLYVHMLTNEDASPSLPRLRPHMAAIFVVALLMATSMLVPSDVNDLDGLELSEDDPVLLQLVLIVLAVLIGDILFQAMVVVYLVLIIKRLGTHRRRLRDIFSTTESRELRWIWVITMAGGLFWLCSIAVSAAIWTGAWGLTQDNPWVLFLGRGALVFLFWVIGVWGLRQRAVMMRQPSQEPEVPDAPLKKYEKSALDAHRAARITEKIETAMKTDLLYRDPNLSLWELAKHIGVTSHYVSQTLNTQLGSSFFDYVNRWRVEDAVGQLISSDETILVISYDVGFNSRSAFYKAFKRQTGKTPSDYR